MLSVHDAGRVLAVSNDVDRSLTPAAATWVTTRLEDAFRLHGTVPEESLDQLDWP